VCDHPQVNFDAGLQRLYPHFEASIYCLMHPMHEMDILNAIDSLPDAEPSVSSNEGCN